MFVHACMNVCDLFIHFTYVCILLVLKVYKSIKCDIMKRMGRCTKGIFCAFAHDDGKASLLFTVKCNRQKCEIV